MHDAPSSSCTCWDLALMSPPGQPAGYLCAVSSASSHLCQGNAEHAAPVLWLWHACAALPCESALLYLCFKQHLAGIMHVTCLVST
jgi:hypothetical protein